VALHAIRPHFARQPVADVVVEAVAGVGIGMPVE
jgi:hypothetical protein